MEILHVLNRGVDKRKIFLDDKDYLRFIHDLYEFNDGNWVTNNFHAINFSAGHPIDIASRYIVKRERKLLVDIHAFALMPNHYHLLLSSRTNNGISKFMQKLNMGYAKYFNQKNERTGALFEGRYRSVAVIKENHLLHLPYYIHLNPLDLVAPEWRNRRMDKPDRAIRFLENYRWSSFLDYTGKKNFPSVISQSFLSKILGSTRRYKTETANWIKGMDLDNIKKVMLE